VTEAKWLAANDPGPMLELLRDRGSVSDRKLRLFACACCRQVWNHLTDEKLQKAVAVAEEFADGEGSPEELRRLRRAEDTVSFLAYYGHHRDARRVRVSAARAVWEASRQSVLAGPFPAVLGPQRVFVSARAFRCVFSNPFRPALAVQPSWLTWQGSTVVNLARSSYEDRCLPKGTLEPARLAVLADALEDAGCAHTELLGHLRGP
jgi:hypothetical protein